MTTLRHKANDVADSPMTPEDTTRFMDQGGTEGIRDVPGGSPVDLSGGLDDRCRGWESRYCEADAWPGIGCVRDSTALPGRCISHDLRGATRRRNLGNPCVPKEIDAEHQDAKTPD